MTHVLLVEDDPRIREIVEKGLGARGFAVTSAADGTAGAELASKLEIDCVLLDLVLPGLNGLQVLEEIRTAKPRLPVIVLTALDEIGAKVGGLDAGADDYVTKPFAIEELVARIRARLRTRDQDHAVMTAGRLTVDLVAHRAVLDGHEVRLSARELALLATFVRNSGQVLSRHQLLNSVWGIDFETTSNVVDGYVAALRRKLDADWIETVRGLGYRFVVPEAATAEETAS